MMRFVRWALIFCLAGVTMAPSFAAKAAKRDPFLDEVQKRAFLFFWHEADPKTGLIKDRSHNFAQDDYDVASVASTGFGLTALCIGAEHGWVSKADARQRALTTLRFLDSKVARRRGLFAHFVKLSTGERAWNSEYSTIDTALLLAGAITAGRYFGGEVRTLAEKLNAAVDWVYWSPRHFISHGSRPEQGEFIHADYAEYSEAPLLYAIALGSPTHPIDSKVWQDFRRPIGRYGPYSSICAPALFMNQYPAVYIDLRGKHDRFADYWENGRTNTLANRQFCIDTAPQHKGYGPNGWGLTASDGPDGYEAYGAPPGWTSSDGTLNPSGPGGSLMFTPDLSRAALAAMYHTYGARLWGRYGFSDSYNVDRNWFDKDVIGIDTGATLLSIENHRTGLVWRLFMSDPSMRRGAQRMGLVPNPRSVPSIRVAGYAKDAERTVTFRLPAKAPAAWKGQNLLLYGGVADSPVSLILNGKSLGRAAVPEKGVLAPGFAVSASNLRWGRPNTLTIRVEGNKPAYGPINLGPRTALEFRPLAISPVISD